jgi:nitrite reductase (NADH) large subunit
MHRGDYLPEFDYVILGNGAAGVGGVEGIRTFDPKGTIAVVGDEDVLPYSRCFLTGYISGRYTEKNMSYRPATFFERNQVLLYLGRKAVSLNPLEKKVFMDDGSQLSYKKLLLATGSSAVMHEVRGSDLPGVHMLRTIKDALAISSGASNSKSAVVMGGGLVGIGLAIALYERGLQVHLIVTSDQLLSQNIDRESADLVVEHLRKKGIDVQLNQDVVEILGINHVSGVRLTDGRILECELVVAAKGVRMNTDLAASAGLSVRRGVLVDDRMRTSVLDIYAAGDVAEAKDFITGRNATLTLWPVASEQGRIAGTNMAGGDVAYQGGAQIIAVNFLGMPITSIGEAREPRDPSASRILMGKDPRKRYQKLVLRGERVIGATMIGNVVENDSLIEMPCTRIDVRKVRDLLVKEDLDFDILADALLVKEQRPKAHQ